MQLSWLVRRRMVVLIPARGSARRNLLGDAALKNLLMSLLVGPPVGALHQHLQLRDGYVHDCGAHDRHAEASCRTFCAPCGSAGKPAVTRCERRGLQAGMHVSMLRAVVGLQRGECSGVGPCLWVS